ncbi:sperm-associated antigen 6-like [Phymastichus coffea]|uniref:sperm-associated antigen 6-like n=1 Tax=Phymastichus coffea TaxID=108790 RepID=UPI00273AA0B3|nr:sperm-associated antigen 6-like [Phymastichus coffea]
MTPCIIHETLNQYQKSRILFVQAISRIALLHQHIEYFNEVDILDLLCPLLYDVLPLVKQFTVIALARLANQDYMIASLISKKIIFSQLLENIQKQSEFYKQSVLFLLRMLMKHSVEITLTVISQGGMEAINLCLQDFNSDIRKSAAWTIGYVARHNEYLALAVVETGAVSLLVSCLQSSQSELIQSTSSALCDISKHTSELAQAVIDAGAIPLLVKNSSIEDTKLNHQTLLTLVCIAKHSVQLSNTIVQSQLLSDIFSYDNFTDNYITKTATNLVKEISKHGGELVECMFTEEGIKFLIQVMSSTNTPTILSAILALGYAAGYSNRIAMNIIEMKGLHSLAKVFRTHSDFHTFAISIWAAGQIGKHSFEHANAIAETDILTIVLAMYNCPLSSKKLKSKCKVTLKLVLQNCIKIEVLKTLLSDCPSDILKYILNQFTKILPIDSKARQLFITTGGLKEIQNIKALPDSNLSRLVKIIKCCFPEEIIRLYSPGYSDSLLKTVEHYQPNCLLNEEIFTMFNDNGGLYTIQQK